MNAQAQDVGAIFTRIERLERENRRLKRVGLSVLLIGSVALLLGQAKVPQHTVRAGAIEANSIALVASNGKVRAALDVTNDGAMLRMMDSRGDVRLTLISGDEHFLPTFIPGTGLYLGDHLRLDKGSDVDVRAELKTGLLELTDGNGTVINMVLSSPLNQYAGSHTTVNLGGETATLRVGLLNTYHTEIGSSALVTPATGERNTTSSASVVLFDNKSNVIWKAP